MDAPTLDALTFRINRSALPKAYEAASRFGVTIVEQELDLASTACVLYEYENHEYCSFNRLPDYYKAWASRLCAQFVEVVAQAPVSDWSVVALATKIDNAPMFHEFNPAVGYWTTERMDGIDFSRCDHCGVRSHRTRAFIVQKGDEFKQIGGACASQLDLTKKLRAMLDGFMTFMSFVEQEEEFGAWRRGKVSNFVDLAHLAILVDELIAFEGYVSGKAAEGRMSTRQSAEVMLFDDSKLGREMRKTDIWARTQDRMERGEGAAIIDEVKVWLSEQSDTPFMRNVRTAIEKESRKHMGMICFAVAEIRNWRLLLAERMAERNAKKARLHCYKHVAATPEEVATLCGKSLADMGELLGVEVGAKLKAPAKKAFGKVLPGVWTCTARASWEGQFGWQDMVQLQREDGARVKWITGSLPYDVKFTKGDKYVILSATVGEEMPEHVKYGVQGTKIQRVWAVNVTPESERNNDDE